MGNPFASGFNPVLSGLIGGSYKPATPTHTFTPTPPPVRPANALPVYPRAPNLDNMYHPNSGLNNLIPTLNESILPNAPMWWQGMTTSSPGFPNYPYDAVNAAYNAKAKADAAAAAAETGGSGSELSGLGNAGTPAAEAPVVWSTFDAGIPNAPSWWKAMKPDKINPTSEWLASMNMMIPYLSAEDQKTVAATLYQQDSKNFGYLKGVAEGKPAPTVDENTRNWFTSASRASSAASALDKLAAAMKKGDNDFGAGYKYLKTLFQTVQNFGGGNSPLNQQTRAQQMQAMGALDPLLGQSSGTSGTLAAFGPLAKAFASPYFSGGQISPMYKLASGPYAGNYSWGIPNAQAL